MKTVPNGIQDGDSNTTNTKASENSSFTPLVLMVLASILLAASALVFVFVIFNINYVALDNSQVKLESLLQQIETLEREVLNSSLPNKSIHQLNKTLDTLWNCQRLIQNATTAELQNSMENFQNELERNFTSQYNATLKNLTDTRELLQDLYLRDNRLAELLMKNSCDECIKKSIECPEANYFPSKSASVSESAKHYRRTCHTNYTDLDIEVSLYT